MLFLNPYSNKMIFLSSSINWFLFLTSAISLWGVLPFCLWWYLLAASGMSSGRAGGGWWTWGSIWDSSSSSFSSSSSSAGDFWAVFQKLKVWLVPFDNVPVSLDSDHCAFHCFDFVWLGLNGVTSLPVFFWRMRTTSPTESSDCDAFILCLRFSSFPFWSGPCRGARHHLKVTQR